MKHIIKGAPLQDFVISVSKNKPINWDDLRSKDPQVLHNSKDHILYSEQNMLSGYTELPLSNSKSTHIDHFRKRTLFHNLTFNWNNLIVDEHNDNYGADYKDKNTQNIQDYQLLLDPVVCHPESLMTYDYPDFTLVPVKNLSVIDKDKVIFTIERFNLNHKALTKKRSELYKQIETYVSFFDDNEIKSALYENGQPTFVDWAINQLRNNI